MIAQRMLSHVTNDFFGSFPFSVCAPPPLLCKNMGRASGGGGGGANNMHPLNWGWGASNGKDPVF